MSCKLGIICLGSFVDKLRGILTLITDSAIYMEWGSPAGTFRLFFYSRMG